MLPRCFLFALAAAAGVFVANPCFPVRAFASELHGGATQTAEGAAAGGLFPSITAEALDRTPLKLPDQFEGKQHLLLVSWARDQAAQVDSWTAVSQAIQHTDFTFRVYRMLVSAQENSLYRWWDNASLRASETDPQLLHWSVPLYTDKAAFRRSLGITGDDHQVAAILVDRSGKVLWHAEGPSTDQTRKSLLAAARLSH